MNSPYSKSASGMLFTDMYQFTMAQLYYRMGLHDRPAQFDHFFRSYPDYGDHQAGYCICAGLEWLIDWMDKTRFLPSERQYLANQKGRTGTPLFDPDFLDWLDREGNFSQIDLFAIPEGRVVHPEVPLTVVRGPLALAQILETPLLNQINYQTLIATKAARLRQSAQGGTILEFGLRRAQERGGNAGARGALIGGADYSSNVALSSLMNLPAKGTHGHSMVQLFISLGLSELDAFRAYAQVYPDDCLLLVDTINTLESGIPNAIRVFEELKKNGHEPLGIRLDSGDLAYLSIQAVKLLDQAGFYQAGIVLSNNLDELVVGQIVARIIQEAGRYGVDADNLIQRLSYGVGTRLISSWGYPALGGVYKLVAVKNKNAWEPTIKRSESPGKTINPGVKKTWRLYDRGGKAIADLIGLEDENPGEDGFLTGCLPQGSLKKRKIERSSISRMEELIQPVWKAGRLLRSHPGLDEIRRIREKDIGLLDSGVKSLINPDSYQVFLTPELWALKQKLLQGWGDKKS